MQFLLAFFALAASFYLIVNLAGYGWNSQAGPRAVNADRPAMRDPAPNFTTTAESWGASVISVPFNARVADYLRNLELPLWNPYQALGQPFAAQGEGSPYSPLSIVRSLLPEPLHNSYAVFLFICSAGFFYALCRRLNLSPAAARFVAFCWILSPGLSWHIARHNYIDQFVIFPVLFLAVVNATLQRSRFPWLSTTTAIALFCIGGFVQAMVPSLLVGYIFALYLSFTVCGDRGYDLYTKLGRVTACFILGAAIAAPFLLPIQEILQSGYAKNWLNYSQPTNLKILYNFLFPNLLGPPFGRSRFEGNEVWDDTFAGIGFLLIILITLGALTKGWQDRKHHLVFKFTLTALIILILRSLNIPPFSLLNAVPIIGLQTPKHIHSFLAFLCLLAAGLSLDNIIFANWRRLVGVVVATILFMAAIIGDQLVQSFYSTPRADLGVEDSIWSYLLLISLIASVLIWIFRRSKSETAHRNYIIFALSLIAIGELSFYLLLGVGHDIFYWKLLVSAFFVISALLFHISSYRIATVMIIGGLGIHACIIVFPRVGLSPLIVPESNPAFLRSIGYIDRINYRSFGVFPDFSSALRLQDISVASAFTTLEFNAFVKIVAHRNEQVLLGFSNSFFMLAGRTSFPLGLYLESKPIFDWFGVRYLIADKAFFGPEVNRRQDAGLLLNGRHGVRAIYDDPYSIVIESDDAQPKIMFTANYEVVRSRAEVFRRLIHDPSSILGPPLIEAAQADPLGLVTHYQPKRSETPILLNRMDSNKVTFVVNAATPGMVVIRDSFYPGWHALVNGIESPVLRVNGIARGVAIAEPGTFAVELYYSPTGLRWGAVLAISAILVIVLATIPIFRHREKLGKCIVGIMIGGVCVATVGIYLFESISKVPPATSKITLDPAETFVGFDLRGHDRLLNRLNTPTDDRTLILQSWGKRFPSAPIAPSPLPLITGDIFINSDGDLIEVDVDGTLLAMKPAQGTRICLLDTGIRGSDDWTTSTLPLPVIGQLTFSGTEWIAIKNNDGVTAPLCDRDRASGRIRFGWLPK